MFGGAATTAVQLAAAAAPADSGTVMPGTPRYHTSQLAAAFTGASSAMLHKGVTLVLTNESDRTEHHASAWSPRRTGNVGGWNATSATARSGNWPDWPASSGWRRRRWSTTMLRRKRC